jgi:ubiquinone/menaquinone biosynthesis C-methylase UbiE
LSYHVFHHDEAERRMWQNPEQILAEIGLKDGDTFVDVGCGEGFFAIPAAKIVGGSGRVYCVDVHGRSVEKVKQRAKAEGLNNTVAKVGRAEDTIFCEGCADIVFFGIDLHDFEDAPKVLANARRMLKPIGKLVDLDWKRKLMSKGPPFHIRFSEEKAVGLIREAGFEVQSVKDSGKYHYLVVARPKEITH